MNPKPAALHTYLELATRAAQAGGQILRKHLGHLQQIRTKSAAGDLVTEADEASEKAILALLQAEVPEHGILAEESGQYSPEADYLWAIDPLDGTLNYAHQVPFFCVSIGLLYRLEPVLGVVYAPRLDELFQGIPGQGAWLNGEPIAVSDVQHLQQAFLATGFPYRKAELPHDNNYPEFMHLADRCQDVRRPGSAALDLCYVACGRFDAFWERHLNPWDVSAGAALVRAAGGTVSAYAGPLDPHSGEILASNGAVHAQMQAELKQVRQAK